ncbi:hypothetical protein DCM91_18330 [Chitinophaga costaii]|nr:hypothetical protein [Chitinophaga costaii]PUZ20719.1 hypothetical protein DCM91_18330 [Chitinophaga costaii]
MEILVAFVFAMIAQIFYKKVGLNFKSIFKGVAERLFLTIALVHDLTSALTFFSALKLATRLKHKEADDEHNKFNDYYLMGNLASVTVAILYVYVYKNFDAIPLFYKLSH